jgi:hypothetical protein
MLGPVEIYREFSRPLAADAWATRRARHFVLHRVATSSSRFEGHHHRYVLGRNGNVHNRKELSPHHFHIRKALNSNQPLKQNFILYRDGDYQLNPEHSYRIDVEEFDQLVTRGETHDVHVSSMNAYELTNKLSNSTAAILRREATNRGSMNREVTTARNTFTCSNHWLESRKNRKNGPGHFNWPSRSCTKIPSEKIFTVLLCERT